MTISPKHLKDICLLGCQEKSKTCRYLKSDELDEGKWYCQKLQPHAKVKIDVTIEAFGHRGHVSVLSAGDNCPGYPVLKHIQQGYDVVG